MARGDRREVVKKDEMRTKEIANMIGEGGLGADKYYDIKKEGAGRESDEEEKKEQ